MSSQMPSGYGFSSCCKHGCRENSSLNVTGGVPVSRKQSDAAADAALPGGGSVRTKRIDLGSRIVPEIGAAPVHEADTLHVPISVRSGLGSSLRQTGHEAGSCRLLEREAALVDEDMVRGALDVFHVRGSNGASAIQRNAQAISPDAQGGTCFSVPSLARRVSSSEGGLDARPPALGGPRYAENYVQRSRAPTKVEPCLPRSMSLDPSARCGSPPQLHQLQEPTGPQSPCRGYRSSPLRVCGMESSKFGTGAGADVWEEFLAHLQPSRRNDAGAGAASLRAHSHGPKARARSPALIAAQRPIRSYATICRPAPRAGA